MPRWPLTAASLEGLAVWDAVFFLRISQCGYEYDKFHAFFPGLPAAMWLLKETGNPGPARRSIPSHFNFPSILPLVPSLASFRPPSAGETGQSKGNKPMQPEEW